MERLKDMNEQLKDRNKQDELIFIKHNKNLIEMRLNRKSKMNSFNDEMGQIFLKKIVEYQLNDENKILLVTGGECKSFCSGGDLVGIQKDLNEMGDKREFIRKIQERHDSQYKSYFKFSQLKCKKVSVIDGHCIGAGNAFLWGADYQVVNEQTIFQMPETNLGVFPDALATYFMPRFHKGYSFALYLALTAQTLSGYLLFQYSIVTHYTTQPKHLIYQNIINLKSTHQLNHYLNSINYTISPIIHIPNINLIQQAFQINQTFQNTVKNLENIIQNDSPPNQQWAINILNDFQTKSWFSLNLTQFLFNKGYYYTSLLQCIQTEHNMAGWSLYFEDFQEGVKAKFIRKDKKPKWKYTYGYYFDSQTLQLLETQSYYKPIDFLSD